VQRVSAGPLVLPAASLQSTNNGRARADSYGRKGKEDLHEAARPGAYRSISGDVASGPRRKRRSRRETADRVEPEILLVVVSDPRQLGDQLPWRSRAHSCGTRSERGLRIARSIWCSSSSCWQKNSGSRPGGCPSGPQESVRHETDGWNRNAVGRMLTGPNLVEVALQRVARYGLTWASKISCVYRRRSAGALTGDCRLCVLDHVWTAHGISSLGKSAFS